MIYTSEIVKAMEIAKRYYDEKTFKHAKRVAEYVSENSVIPKKYLIDCICLAWMHDLLEDTEYEHSPQLCCRWLNDYEFAYALQLLTKPEGMSYVDYIRSIKENYGRSAAGSCAYFVKLADMKDHLSQTETLTDRLKEKYLAALPYLL